MKLRSTLRVLSFLAVLSAFTTGYVYYSSLKEYAIQEAERQAEARVENIRKNLSAYLSENFRPVRVLAGMEEIKDFTGTPVPDKLADANRILDHFRETLSVDVCYVMNVDGLTIASSNRNDPDSFVGQNFGFRPYFQHAIQGMPSNYLALGTFSKKRGAYASYPIFIKGQDTPSGVVVIKAFIHFVENELGAKNGEIVLVTDPNGVIFVTNKKGWRFQLLWEVTPDVTTRIVNSRQFGSGPMTWIGFKRQGTQYAVDSSGNRYLIKEMEIDHYPGWHIVHLHSFENISRAVSNPVIKITLPVVLVLCFLVGLSVFILYRKADTEILQRKIIQRALKESEARYRALYHHTPALLHSIDTQGRLLSVSDYWVEHLGYSREEVIGRKLTDFMTSSARIYAEETIFPEFFRTGLCKDVPYQFVKKNGELIDILLSAIADRDERGAIARSLAVSIDVTERNKAVAALKSTKEELSRYSKDLERLVKKRTREISSILRYTPAMVYMKDKKGRYILVNSRYEDMFGVLNEDVGGKTDREILPGPVADQFLANDLKVLEEGISCQVEEHIPQSDGEHTYLSVKFPIYDGAGHVTGVCGISTDITAVKRAQDQLRRLSGSIMANQEKERAYVARELHDELGQMLTALRMEAVWLHKRLEPGDQSAAGRALTMCNLIDKTIEEVRSMAIRLRPGVLDHLGLVDALEWYTADFERRTGITCVFEHDDVPEVRDTMATAAYRIAQEALTNVARHAAAGKVEVMLKQEDSHIILSVSDNGCGFNLASLQESEGLGVAGMRERAALMNGRLEMDSTIDEGTHVIFKVPTSVAIFTGTSQDRRIS